MFCKGNDYNYICDAAMINNTISGMKICLSKLPWYSVDNIRVTGFIRKGNKYLTDNELLNYFTDIDTIQKFEQLLKEANGQFSVIIRTKDEIWAATDRLRNYPLFYTRINGGFVISDDCYKLAEELPEKCLNPAAVDCFLATGYVLNNLTLIKNIFQVEAGEYIKAGDSFSRKFYHDIYYAPVVKKDFSTSAYELNNLISVVFRNHFQALSDKFIVIPLSGGFDSRLVASMCSKYHPENVLCYTYGTENNCEVAPAKEVARRLGFKWINIIYNSGLIEGYLNDDLFKNYYPYVSNLSSMFFMQEYFAVKYIKENRLVPENSVFIPGFCGDVLAGCNLFPSMNKSANKEQIAMVIYKEFFRLTKPNRSKTASIIKLICDKIPHGKNEIWKIFEGWDHKEPKAKFNVNSAKVFSFFEYNFVLPLWDSQLEDFFSTLPFQFKLDKKLYDYVLTEYVFKDLNLNLSNELNPLPIQKSIQRVKERVKDFVPNKIKDQFITHRSPVFYDEITRVMIEDMGSGRVIHPRQSNYYNSYITQWYLLKTKELLKI